MKRWTMSEHLAHHDNDGSDGPGGLPPANAMVAAIPQLVGEHPFKQADEALVMSNPVYLVQRGWRMERLRELARVLHESFGQDIAQIPWNAVMEIANEIEEHARWVAHDSPFYTKSSDLSLED